MDYAISHEGKNYIPNGTSGISDADQHNKELENSEIEWLKTHPQHITLYVKHNTNMANVPRDIITWLGTKVSDWATFSLPHKVGFGFHSRRRSISCSIFGVKYYGWYFESSGSYCRLKKAKRQ